MKIISVKALNKVSYITFSNNDAKNDYEITVCVSYNTPIALYQIIRNKKDNSVFKVWAISEDKYSKTSNKHGAQFFIDYDLPNGETPVLTNEVELRMIMRGE